MAVIYRVTPKLKAKFKEPFGSLLRGTSSETMDKLEILVEVESPPMIVSVGDTVSVNFHSEGLKTDLAITDSLSMRKPLKPPFFEDKKVVHVKNPQGTITDAAIDAVQKALAGKHKKPIHLVVEGEEDLLTIAAVLYAPDGSFVVYGQPNEGIVVVRATPEKKAEAQKLLNEMAVRKAK